MAKNYYISRYVISLSFQFYMFQILDMKDSELKMLADHMGHNVNIHTEVYRMQSSLLERSKVASVLIAVEKRKCKSF